MGERTIGKIREFNDNIITIEDFLGNKSINMLKFVEWGTIDSPGM